MNICQIIAAAENYSRTGDIADVLIPFFQQDGRWLGDARDWRKSNSRKIRSIMKLAFLPEQLRTSVNEVGENVLRTSFVCKDKGSVVVLWNEVMGSIEVQNDGNFSAPNLQIVGGHLHANTDLEVDLPNLRTVGGDFDVMETWKLHAPRITSVGGSLMVNDFNLGELESVGKRLWMRWTQYAVAPKLRHVGADLNADGAQTFIAPVLESVGCDLLLSDWATSFHAPMLHTVGASLGAPSATIFEAPKLRRVGGHLNTTSAADFYHPDVNVGGTWKMHLNAEVRLIKRLAAKRIMKAQPSLEI